MTTLSKSDQRILKLAAKGGGDAELILLDSLEELEEKLNALAEKTEKEISKLEAKVDESVREVKESSPNLDDVLKSVRGQDGKDSDVPGPQGEPGSNGKDGLDGKDGNDGKDGVDGTNGVDGNDGKDGKDGVDGKDGSPDTPEQVRDKLEELQGEERLDASAIKNLQEELKELHSEIKKAANRRLGMRKIPIVKRYNLTSQCDGVTKTFTLPNDTKQVLGVWGTQFPVTFNPLTDWTFAGRTLTLTSQVAAPETGQTLWCLIETLFYG